MSCSRRARSSSVGRGKGVSKGGVTFAKAATPARVASGSCSSCSCVEVPKRRGRLAVSLCRDGAGILDPAVAIEARLCAIAFDRDSLEEQDVVHPARKERPGLCHGGDGLPFAASAGTFGYDQVVQIDLEALPDTVRHIFFCISLLTEALGFADVPGACLKMLHLDICEGQELARYSLDAVGRARAVIAARLYKDEGRWWLQPIVLSVDGKTQEQRRSVFSILRGVDGGAKYVRTGWCGRRRGRSSSNPLASRVGGASSNVAALDPFAAPSRVDSSTLVALPRDTKGVVFGLGWNSSNDNNLDIDASAVMFSRNEKPIAEVYFYKREAAGMRHRGDNLTGEASGDDEVVEVVFELVPDEAEEIYFCVNVYTSGQSFKDADAAYCRIVDEADPSRDLTRFNISGTGEENGLIVARLYRDQGRWGLQTINSLCHGTTWRELLPHLDAFRQQVGVGGVSGLADSTDLPAIRPTPGRDAMIFEQLDRDHNGAITCDEWDRAMHIVAPSSAASPAAPPQMHLETGQGHGNSRLDMDYGFRSVGSGSAVTGSSGREGEIRKELHSAAQETLSLPSSLERLRVNFGWTARPGRRVDMDTSAVLYDAYGDRELDVAYFYKLEGSGVKHNGDCLNSQGGESIDVNMREVPASAQQIFFCMSMYNDGHTFEDVSEVSCQVVDTTSQTEVCRRSFCEMEGKRGFVVARLYKFGGSWQFQTIGKWCMGKTWRECSQDLQRLRVMSPSDLERSSETCDRKRARDEAALASSDTGVWSQHMSSDGRVFYFNSATGVSSWVGPPQDPTKKPRRL